MAELEIEGARVLAVGVELRLPEGVYRVVRPEPFDELGEARARLEELAVAHGGVVFELLPDDPGDDLRPGALLRVRGAWVVAELGGVEIGVATSAAGEAGAWRLITLLADGMEDEGEVVGGVGEVRGREDGSWAGEQLRVRRHPLFGEQVRDWVWSWGGSTYGPVMLILRLGRSRGEIAEFLARWAPMPYVHVEEGRYGVPVRGPTSTLREIRIWDGGITLVRDFHAPPDEVVEFDGGLLGALAGGALGELVWDVIEGDWGAYLATGHTAGSLGEYLDLAVDAEGLVARYREVFAVRTVDASTATTPGEVVGAVARFLGAAVAVEEEAFDAWLAGLAIEGLPRRVEVTLAAGFEAQHGYQWFFDRVHAAQPRISWSIRRG